MTPKNMIITGGAVAGSIAAMVALWIQMGGAVPASQLYVTQGDDALDKKLTRGMRKVETLNKQQTEESAKWGRKIYSEELNKLLRIDPPDDPEQHQYWKDSVDRAVRQKKFYTDKEIELRKK